MLSARSGALVVLHNGMADGQAQARAFAFQFGGEKGIKNLMQILFGDAGAGIDNGDLNEIIAGNPGDGQGAALGHGLAGIHEEIQENLFDLLGIHHNLGQGFGQLVINADIDERDSAFGQSEGLGHDFPNLHRAEFRFRGLGKTHEILDDIGNPGFLFRDDLQSFRQSLVIGQLIDQAFQDLQVQAK